MKNFCAIKFEDQTHSVIPSKWITKIDNMMFAKFPSNKIEEFSRSNIDAKENWRNFKIIEVLAEAKSYDRCNKKLYTAGGIETSDGEELNISTAKDLPAIPKIHLKSSSSIPSSRKRNVDEVSKDSKDEKLDKILMKLTSLSNKVDILMEKSKEPKKAKIGPVTFPDPAMTVEELDEIGKFENLDSALDDMCGFTSLQSINIILKRILSKELANKYSYSGLGEKRKRTKLPFKNHVVLKHILASLHRKGFSDRQQNIQQIQRVLRGAKDWDGFRRPKSVTEKIQQDKENATSIEAEKSRKDVTKATSSETFF